MHIHHMCTLTLEKFIVSVFFLKSFSLYLNIPINKKERFLCMFCTLDPSFFRSLSLSPSSPVSFLFGCLLFSFCLILQYFFLFLAPSSYFYITLSRGFSLFLFSAPIRVAKKTVDCAFHSISVSAGNLR